MEFGDDASLIVNAYNVHTDKSVLLWETSEALEVLASSHRRTLNAQLDFVKDKIKDKATYQYLQINIFLELVTRIVDDQ